MSTRADTTTRPAPMDATIAIAHLADMITTVTGNDNYDGVATKAASLYAASATVAAAAGRFAASDLTDEQFAATVAEALRP